VLRRTSPASTSGIIKRWSSAASSRVYCCRESSGCSTENPDALMREVAKRGGIDSPLAVDGIAVTAAWFAVLAPFVSRRGRRAGGHRRSPLARHA
jgi:hypothetical protein